MKSVVVDCSVVIPWYFPEENADIAQKVFEDYRNNRTICCAPALLHAEFGNAAWKKVVRKLCGRDHAATQINLFLRSGIKFYRCDEILPDAFDIANRLNISVYDALYCALAKTLKAELATLDTRIFSTAAKIGIRCFED